MSVGYITKGHGQSWLLKIRTTDAREQLEECFAFDSWVDAIMFAKDYGAGFVHVVYDTSAPGFPQEVLPLTEVASG